MRYYYWVHIVGLNNDWLSFNFWLNMLLMTISGQLSYEL